MTDFRSMMSDDYLHIALLQADLVWEDLHANRRRFEQLFSRLPGETELVVLPEMFSTGFSMNTAQLAESMDGEETVGWMKKQASVLQMILAGSLIVREGDSFFNRFIFVSPEGMIEYYDKRHLFSMGEEQLHFTPGKERKIFRIKSFRILPQICYDLRFPVFCRNHGEYDLMINCANWPASRSDVWTTLLKARAIENQVYVAGVNRTGTDGNGIRYDGHSLIVDPRGREIAVTTGNGEQIIAAKLSKSPLDRFRKKFPVLPDADPFTIHF